MCSDQVMPGVSGARYHRGAEEEEPRRSFSTVPVLKILVGLIIAIDISFLAAPLYYGTFNPCEMVALSKSSLHSKAVDDEIGISDEINYDVFYVSSVWVRSHKSIASCAGDIGGRTFSSLLP